MNTRSHMPILGSILMSEIPFDMIAPHEAQAQLNHGKSLERLAQRGGLSACEAIDILDGRKLGSAKPSVENASHLINKVRNWRAAQRLSAVKASTVSAPGYHVKSPCGREWWLPEAAVRTDYANFLMQADGLTREAADLQAAQAGTFVEAWLNEQYVWAEIDRDGVLISPATPEQVLRALDTYRAGAYIENERCESQPVPTPAPLLTVRQIEEGLKLHHLTFDKPSQLADAFRAGANWAHSMVLKS